MGIHSVKKTENCFLSDKSQKKIMRKVYIVWFAKSFYFKASVLVVLVGASSLHVSFINIARNAANASQSFPGFFVFITKNFVAADVLSEALAVCSAAALMTLGWQAVKTGGVFNYFRFLNAKEAVKN